ncbi:MAG: metalloregulator ArsR/SmtB family transcription factor [Spirochaetes bacterium]|nr:metalloregulator ArsR/SmtB family transcription factor [Spirochaetota bacterium]
MSSRPADAVRKARESVPAPEPLAALGDFFKLIGDPTRLGILHALAPGELCVRDLSEALGMSESATSHQLALLRRARMVKARRAGRSVYYGLCDRHVRQLVDAARVHLAEGGAVARPRGDAAAHWRGSEPRSGSRERRPKEGARRAP